MPIAIAGGAPLRAKAGKLDLPSRRKLQAR
eukprot:SAG11_NODE_36894_length_259_cov_0.962500_1_plen_29_part_01